LVPLAKLLGFCTEEIALYTNQTMGALLNATFGNAIELILSIIALSKNLVLVVQSSLLGSILSNLLFVMGFSFLLGGLYHKEQTFNSTAAQTGASLLAMTCFSLIIPAVFDVVAYEHDVSSQLILSLSRGTAIILIIIYALYIFFQLSTHTHLFRGTEEEHEEPKVMFSVAMISLFVITGIVALCAEYLVGSIEGLSKTWGLSETFVGLILLPIVGNAAEHLTAVSCAMKNKMELTLGIGLGASMQIALLITPLCVIVGWIMHVPMTLDFGIFETVMLFISIYVVNSVISDGRSHWLEGVMLLGAYLVIAIAFFLLPEA